MAERQSILIVDDRSENLLALRQVLRDVDAQVVEATNGNDALLATLNHDFAVVILDVRMPGMSGFEVAENLRGDDRTKLTPIIFVTASDQDEQSAFRGYEAGGVDYIVKPYAAEVLLGKLRVFLEMDRYRRDLQLHRDQLEALVAERTKELTIRNRIAELFLTAPDDQTYPHVLDALVEAMDSPLGVLGHIDDRGALVVTTTTGSGGVGSRAPSERTVIATETAGESRWPAAVRNRRTVVTNQPTTLLSSPHLPAARSISLPLAHRDEIVGLIQVADKSTDYTSDDAKLLETLGRDIAPVLAARLRQRRHEAERGRAEAALRESEEKLRGVFASVKDGILVADAVTGRLVMANATLCQMLGYTESELMGLSMADIHPAEDLPMVTEAFERQLRKETPLAAGIPVQRADGTLFFADVNGTPVEMGGRPCVVGCFRDVTEKRALEDQFRHAQRMESVGRLAGGVAHDFNNLLTVILSTAQCAAEELPAEDPLADDLADIRKAGERAVGLTRQLLAFSRRQVLRPETVMINGVVRGLQAMLGRLLGEDIRIDLKLVDELWPTEADVGQLEQVIMNLAVNARDAMPQGGVLTIETANVELDQSLVGSPHADEPSQHVKLALTDTGAGMSAEVREQVFEPFFTTKGAGQGTGLGLSTVYGIVQQSGGQIEVRSELGQGTTFELYLPRGIPDSPRVAAADSPEPADLGGKETILVVEDDEAVRRSTIRILRRFGYAALEAGDGAQAEQLCLDHTGAIHLLLTDVIMPGASGRDTAERIRTLRPELRVLYMSGYTDDAIAHHGVLEPDTLLIEKPFTPEGLARRLRQVLDAPQ